jgi:hypothetical protein
MDIYVQLKKLSEFGNRVGKVKFMTSSQLNFKNDNRTVFCTSNTAYKNMIHFVAKITVTANNLRAFAAKN